MSRPRAGGARATTTGGDTSSGSRRPRRPKPTCDASCWAAGPGRSRRPCIVDSMFLPPALTVNRLAKTARGRWLRLRARCQAAAVRCSRCVPLPTASLLWPRLLSRDRQPESWRTKLVSRRVQLGDGLRVCCNDVF